LQGDKWLKIAAAIWILSVVGGAIALSKGVRIVDVIEDVGTTW
jgi:hypothetical protein